MTTSRIKHWSHHTLSMANKDQVSRDSRSKKPWGSNSHPCAPITHCFCSYYIYSRVFNLQHHLSSRTNWGTKKQNPNFCIVTTYSTHFQFDIYFWRGWDIFLINNKVFWWKVGPFPLLGLQYADVQNREHLIFNETCDEKFSLFHFLCVENESKNCDIG